VRAERAAFSPLSLSQRKFRRSGPPLATLKTDRGLGNGEAANRCAERSVAEDGQHKKRDRLAQEDWGVSNGTGSNAVPQAGPERPGVPGIGVIASVGAKVRA
jgi:hypothetical protein